MVDIVEISAIVAAAGVIIGVVFAVLELRNLVKERQTDLIVRLSSNSTSTEFVEAVVDVLEAEFKDYDDFVKRYGKIISKNQVPMSFLKVGSFYEQIGVLLRHGLIDAYLVGQLLPISEMWEKMKPIVEGMRKEYHSPHLLEWFEHLYNETKKREQQLGSKTP